LADISEFMKSAVAGIREHLRSYLATDGEDGYLRDMRHGRGSEQATCLILKTIGRRSGRPYLVPLLFDKWNDEFVIVASKAGADEHPAWYLNLTASDEVAIQVKDKRYRCEWRVAEGGERRQAWKIMTDCFPGYDDYQSLTEREIPVVVLTPTGPIEEKFSLA
jgi:deazaflavin-dependent oxidoreductase (nitroreductase family)